MLGVKNYGCRSAVGRTVRWAGDDTIRKTKADNDLYWDVDLTLTPAVIVQGLQAEPVDDAVYHAGHGDADHPALEDFLKEAL